MDYLNKIIVGDVLEKLKTLPDECVHCVITSPPYYGLRDYGTGKWDGGDPACAHRRSNVRPDHSGRTITGRGMQGSAVSSATPYKEVCGICGARRVDQQLGLEPTPQEYVAKMVVVFREIWRVLRKDGTLWLNMGSSYAGSGKGRLSDGTHATNPESKQSTNRGAISGRLSKTDAGRGEPACGTSCRELGGSQDRDLSSTDLCDGCRVALFDRTSRSGSRLAHESSDGADGPILERSRTRGSSRGISGSDFRQRIGQSGRATSDRPPSKDHAGALPLSALASTSAGSSGLRRDECCHCANCGACLSVLRSSARDAQLCVRTPGGIFDTAGREVISAFRMTDRVLSSEAWGYLTTGCLKNKDLIAMPWLLALALQMDGWFLRLDDVWFKRNAMPGSQKDRPTVCHEYVFLLSKSSRYFYDEVGVREKATGGAHGRGKGEYSKLKYPSGWDSTTGFQAHTQRIGRYRVKSNPRFARAVVDLVTERSLRSVWDIPSEPYPGAHFATFPQRLPEVCILAGTSPHGCCAACGAPYRRLVRNEYVNPGNRSGNGVKYTEEMKHAPQGSAAYQQRLVRVTRTIGWQRTCRCKTKERVPAVVLDPFMGSGTTAVVAIQWGRNFVGIELKPDYVEMALKRLSKPIQRRLL